MGKIPKKNRSVNFCQGYMRIIIGVHHFPPRYTGGAEWRAYRAAAELQARGHTVHVICVENIDKGPRDGVAWEDEIFQGVAIRRLSYNLANVPEPFRWEYDNLWIGEHLRVFCEQWKPDLFHLISGYLLSGRTLFVMSELGIPSVVTLTDFWFLCRRINLLKRDGKISKLPITSVECARCFGEEKRRYRWLGRIWPSAMRWYWKRQTPKIRAFDMRTNFLHEALNSSAAIICPSEFLRSVFIQAGIKPERLYFSRQGRDFPKLTASELEKLLRKCYALVISGKLRLIRGYISFSRRCGNYQANHLS